MAQISRRLRFEILRRDGHTCRYCGASAPDVALEVDHVIPVTLGGGDEPANLVSACVNCNRGKSSVPADAQIVEDVARDALRWKAAMEESVRLMQMERQLLDGPAEQFCSHWDAFRYTTEQKVLASEQPADVVTDPLDLAWRQLPDWSASRRQARPVAFLEGFIHVQIEPGRRTDVRRELNTKAMLGSLSQALGAAVIGHDVEDGWSGPVPYPPTPVYETVTFRLHIPKPADWRSTVEHFLGAGLPLEELLRLTDVAMGKQGVDRDERWRYFCGCVWRTLSSLQEDARRILESEADGLCG